MYGYDNLKPRIEIDETSVECPVRGCLRRVARQRRRFRIEDRFRCPEHRIIISPSTFEYDREMHNFLCRDVQDLGLLTQIRQVKRESRMARDNSEDAVTWNVFRSLERANGLKRFAESFLGTMAGEQPRLVYWSYCPETNGPWSPLIRTATGFGESVGRHTEPDLAFLFKDLLVLVEVKLASGNATTPSDPANPKSYMTGQGHWFRRVFHEPADFQSVAVAARLYELMRLWLIGTRIAHETGRRFLLVNLVRSAAHEEDDIERRFGRYIAQADQRRFLRLTWEQVMTGVMRGMHGGSESERLTRYFADKTLGYVRQYEGNRVFGVLRRAFDVAG